MAYKNNLNYCIVLTLTLLAAHGGLAHAADTAKPKAAAVKEVKKSTPKKSDSAKSEDDVDSVDQLLSSMKPAAEAAKPGKGAAFRLEDALAEAYLRNPDLQASRAALRAVDETYAQAVSGYRPSVEGGIGYTSTHTEGNSRSSSGDPKTISIEVTQPLYRGGSVEASIESSDNTIKAQRALLKVKEQQILGDAVTAYLDVRRDQELVRLNINNENVLRSHLDASRQRFKLGDITKTDVSQSESRLAEAVADRVFAEGNLKKSRAFFEKVVGVSPDNLIAPDMKITPPATLDEALAYAEKGNPNLLYAQYISASTKAKTRSINGELMPQVDLSGSLDRTYDPSTSRDSNEDTGMLALRATIPLYSGGGGTYSRIRQSRQQETQYRMQINDQERIVRQAVIDAWESLTAANAQMQARKAQIKAAKTALEGVKLENDYGSRTTLDLLDAEQEYLDAQVAEVTADHDRIVASYGLLASVGNLTAEDLGLSVKVYNPDKNFQNVKGKWIGTSIVTGDPDDDAVLQ